MPIQKEEGDPTYPTFGDVAGAREYYEREGYVVVRGLIPRDVCQAAQRSFDKEVRPSKGFLYRQASAMPERHVLDGGGHVLNSILNVQDLASRSFPSFKECGLAVLTHTRLQATLKGLLGEPAKLVQSMYFEGNPATWAHQDSYYLDCAELGRMVGVWVALEEIHRDAGRFYVYPGSSLVELPANAQELGIAFHHDRYKALVRETINERGLKLRAPALGCGDVLFWNSRTIHGSQETRDPHRSRRSFTGHYIPDGSEFVQFQSRKKPLALRNVNGMRVNFPKNQDRFANRLVLEVVGRFPRAFSLAKRILIRVLSG